MKKRGAINAMIVGLVVIIVIAVIVTGSVFLGLYEENVPGLSDQVLFDKEKNIMVYQPDSKDEALRKMSDMFGIVSADVNGKDFAEGKEIQLSIGKLKFVVEMEYLNERIESNKGNDFVFNILNEKQRLIKRGIKANKKGDNLEFEWDDALPGTYQIRIEVEDKIKKDKRKFPLLSDEPVKMVIRNEQKITI